MVERLREAIEKARQRRGGADTVDGTLPVARSATDVASGAWTALPAFTPQAKLLTRHRIITAAKDHPAYAAFDVLRTRLVRTCKDNGWRRVGITSPSKGCGKSMVSLNLAFSLSRNTQLRSMLLDLDLRNPSLATILGLQGSRGIESLLLDDGPVEASFHRIGSNLAVCAGGRPMADSAEILQNPRTIQRIVQAESILQPDILLYDLPPILAGDDVLGLLEHLDAILLIASAGTTLASEITDCERLIASTALLGVVLNRVEDFDLNAYSVGYGATPVSA